MPEGSNEEAVNTEMGKHEFDFSVSLMCVSGNGSSEVRNQGPT